MFQADQTNMLITVLTELKHKRARFLGQTIRNTLEQVLKFQQKRAFVLYTQTIYEVSTRTCLQQMVNGTRMCLAGKINRGGSARKQKLI